MNNNYKLQGFSVAGTCTFCCKKTVAVNWKSTIPFSTKSNSSNFWNTTSKLIGFLALLFSFVGGSFGQVATNSGSGLAATYGSLSAAITALNGATITSPVVITLTGNETAPVGGYSITASGSSINTITIQGSGSIITAATGLTSGSLSDAIFKIIGGDFITLQNFTMQENSANTTTAVATNNMTEWGVALLYASTTNGSQNNIVQNNTISLNRAYSNTFGIYSNTRHTATVPLTAAEITVASGSNSNNKVYGNSISNVDFGIMFVGSITAVAMDSGNDIGGISLSTANTITNWGGYVSGATSLYVGLLASNFCIIMTNQIEDNVSFNTVTSATNINTLTTIAFGGVIKNYGAQPTGLTFTSNYNNNTVTLTNAATTSQMTGMGLQGLTSLSTATLNMNNNKIINCAITGTATSATIIGILNSAAPGVFNVNGNTIRGFTSTASSGGFIGIQQQTNGVVNALNINNNAIGDATLGAITFANANSGALTGISVLSSGAATTANVSIEGNDFRGINYSVNSTGGNTYITQAAAVNSASISSNTFTNLSIRSSGAIIFINHGYTIPITGQCIINNNSIVTAFTRLSAGSITITSTNSLSTTGSINNYTNNNFSNIIVPDNAFSTILGFNNTDGGSGSTKTITGNTFSNWHGGTSGSTGTSSTINCMNFTYLNGVSSLTNNTISNISGRSSITGISMGSSSNLATSITLGSNIISGLNSIGTGGTVTGITSSNTSTVINLSSNSISNLSTTNTTSTANGITISGGTTVNLFGNKIYDLLNSGGFTTSPGVNGILISGGTAANIYNNLIGDLRATAANSVDAIRGISITSTAASTTRNLFNNTIYLNASSTGTNFGTTGIFHAVSGTATTSTLNSRNNMVFNTSTPNGTGVVTALRRNTAATFANYATLSNNNLYFAGTPAANRTILLDGAVAYQTIATFQAAVGTTRESLSFTETSFVPGTYFVSTTGSNANYLQPASGLITQAESGGITISLTSPDYNNVTRPETPGTAWDCGAWEFNGISPAPVIILTSVSPAATPNCSSYNRYVLTNITTLSGTITSAILNYSHNGVAQTPITMVNFSGSSWNGTMLEPTISNATVTWTITATNSLGLIAIYTGASFADVPTYGLTATATATPTSLYG